MNNLERLTKINKDIEECDIKNLKSLSHAKQILINQIIKEIHDPRTKKLKEDIELIKWVIKENGYVDAKELRELEKIKE